MESIKKREKTLFYLFLKQVVIMAAAVIMELMLFLVLFAIGLNMGIILPANHAENYLLQNAEKIAQCIPFSKEWLPPACEYVLFDPEGNYIEGNGKNMDAFAEVLVGEEYRRDYKVIVRDDGYCVIHYSVEAHFADPVLHKIIPHPELTAVAVFVLSFLLTVAVSAFLFGKKLQNKLTPLLLEIKGIKERDLLSASGQSDIREFNEVLSALHEMKAALGASLKKEWEMEQRRRENISALAHDIKTPLTVIKGNAELLGEETDVDQVSAYAERINENADRIEHYIHLLINETKGVEETDTASLSELLSGIKTQSEMLCKTKQIPVFIEDDNLNHPEKRIDNPERILRAVLNIVANAVEYTNPQKGIALYLSEENERLHIKVEDYGRGFSTEALHHATEQFYTEKKERNGIHYGLGLYFAKTVAKELGGELRIENKADGNGAEVTFVLNTVVDVFCKKSTY